MRSQANQEPIWLKRVLIPFWVIRMLFELILIGLYVVVLAAVGKELREEQGSGTIGLLVAYLIVLITVFILDVVAIIKFVRDRLKPLTFLILNIIQTTIWLIILILELRSAAQLISNGARRSNAAGAVVAVVVFLSYLALLIYASVVYHHHRLLTKRGNYAPASNPANPSIPLYTQPLQTSFQQPSGGQNALPTQYAQQSFAQPPQHQIYAPYTSQTQPTPIQPTGPGAEYYGNQPPPAYRPDPVKEPPAGVVEIGPGQ